MSGLRALAGAVGLFKFTLAAAVAEYIADPTPEARAKLDQQVKAITDAFVCAAGFVASGEWAIDNRWPIRKAGNTMGSEFMSAVDARAAWEQLLKQETPHE